MQKFGPKDLLKVVVIAGIIVIPLLLGLAV
jgi:hypothetical protein